MENSDRADSKMQLIEALQSQYPNVFIRAAIYDGRNNLYTSYKLNFGTGLSRQVHFLIHRIVRLISIHTVRRDVDQWRPRFQASYGASLALHANCLGAKFTTVTHPDDI